ncbi:MAG TPA: DUF1003 domain-containing protein [Bryobacteraceae bacterium]|nr:DUF1003 domain-containing protein [Bryobacteraceae bacterium]
MGPAQRNIETVVKMEQDFLQQRSAAARIVDVSVDAVGTMPSFLLHLGAFAGWILVNSGIIPVVRPWDPFPFILLTMFVSMEGVILALFVLMKQNRMSRRADERDHLHLQINLLAEKEITAVLQLQQRLMLHLGMSELAHDPEVQQLAEETAVENLANALKEKLPDD